MKNSAFAAMSPLMIFTTVLPMAIGLEVGAALSVFLTPELRISLLTIHAWSLSLTICGGISVSLHLGNIQRGVQAIRGIGHSFLSREIILSLCFCFLLILSIIIIRISRYESLIKPLLIASALIGLLTAVTIGKVYDLSSQATWRGLIPSLSPLLAAFLFAGVTMLGLIDIPETQRIISIALAALLIVDFTFTMQKIMTFIALKNKPYILIAPQFQKWVIPGYLVKVLLLSCAIIALRLFIIKEFFNLLCLTVLLDRFTFYASSAQLTPSAAIAIMKAQRMREALNVTGNDSA